MALVNESYKPIDGSMHHSWYANNNKVIREIGEKGLYALPEQI